MLEFKDLQTIKHKTEQSAVPFIRNLSTHDEDLCLEYIAISILKRGLTRDRKTELNVLFKPFASFMNHNRIIKSVKKAQGYDYSKEWEITKKFVDEVRY